MTDAPYIRKVGSSRQSSLDPHESESCKFATHSGPARKRRVMRPSANKNGLNTGESSLDAHAETGDAHNRQTRERAGD